MPSLMHQNRRLFYREQGSGPLLLILPGNTASSASHRRELRYFGRTHRAVSLDFSGTGQSERLAKWPLSWWEEGTRDALALLDHLGIERARIMGCSGGAVSALLMAALFPERIEAVIADSCPHRYPPGTLERIVAEREQGMRHLFPRLFWRMANGLDWRAVVQQDSDLLLRMARCGFDPFGDDLRRIRCPVLFTFSRKDRDIPQIEEQAMEMVRLIPQSQTFASDEGGHPLMWTRPSEFRQAADRFLASLKGH